MIGKETIKYSLKNLWHRRARSFLTILSIFVGITTIFIFISFGLGLYNYTNEFTTSSSVDKIIIQAKGMSAPGLDETFKLTDDDLDAVEKTLGIYESVGVYTKVAEINQKKTKKYTFLVSLDPEHPMVMEMSNIKIEKGRLLKNSDSGKTVLGYNFMIADKILPKALTIGDKIEVQGQELEIVGFMQSVGNPQDDAQIYVTNDEVKRIYPDNSDSYGMIIARADINNIDAIVDRVEKNLRSERNLEKGKEDFFVQTYQDLIESFKTVLNIIIGFVILIAGISVVVSAVNTTNTMVTSVLERTKEIGTMKAIGARNSEIFGLFLFESSFLGFISGVLGVVMGFVISYFTGQFLDTLGWGFLKPDFPIYLFVGCVAFATLTGAVSGAFPALNAARTRPAEALRYE